MNSCCNSEGIAMYKSKERKSRLETATTCGSGEQAPETGT